MLGAPARAVSVAALAILAFTACAGPAPAPGPGAIPDVCPGNVRVEVTNNSSTAVDVWWTWEGSRRYLGSAPPGASTHFASDAAGTPRFELGGRLITGRQAAQISYRLFCM